MAEASPAAVHVRLNHVTKRFDGAGTAAVDDVSLAIPLGSFTTLLGPSGCGKTTTLRTIAGFYTPDAGEISIGGQVVNEIPPHRRGTAMVFQDYALFPHMTVEDNVGYGLRLAHVAREPRSTRVTETLRFLGLAGLERRYPNQLSGGQQQRVALARALVTNPAVLLLDEPLSNLDARLRVQIRAELTAIQRQLGITTIYVTHDQDEALAMSDWVAVMNQGKVVQWGTPWEVYYRPRTPFMADFLGSVNLVTADVVGEGLTDGEIRVRLGDVGLTLAAPSSGIATRSTLLAIRPESIRLAPNSELGGQPECVALPGVVEQRTFLGRVMRYTVRVGQQEWLVDQPDPGGSPIADGPVRLLIDPGRVHIVPERDA